MRNSISLSVYFLLVLKCDVKQLFLKRKQDSFRKMKLIPLTILLTSLAVNAQKFRQEQFPFPPQFQSPNAGLFPSDSSLYLPPESLTPIPYFPIKNHNGLQYPLLPPTGTKAPSVYPSPFPFIISTTLVPNFGDDDDDEDKGRIRLSSPPSNQKRMNQSERVPDNPKQENREMRAIPMRVFPQPIQNRNDIKFPFKPQNSLSTMTTTTAPPNPTPAVRRMIIETQKSDLGLDQLRAASIQGLQFIPAGAGLYVSSTTEPAIPILRLSNEMDLDGSFSYEALGADQTHYVQHSRMENLGPDKQEQVVEGSYSYVGDNGQTYTVHYIADSNGFRASGEHLPVAPPVPEIIQRAVQYNLAEEAKKPPHLRDNGLWQDDRGHTEISDNNKTPQFSLPPTRNLFTGKTPEAFSYSFSQGSNTGNNLVAAASNQAPVKTVEYSQQTTEQPKAKPNNGPISPQITFLASQGAHVPSLNPVQDTISRMFTNEKSTMPKLMHYEAEIKESDQDPNKGLWRWQYGINAHNLNQNSNKETISRSFGEGDDIMINFSDMTPQQYTNVIRSQLEYNPEQESVNQYPRNMQFNQHNSQNNLISPFHQNQQQQHINQQSYYENTGGSQSNPTNYNSRTEIVPPSPSTVSSFPQNEEQYKQTANYNQINQNGQMQSTNIPVLFNQFNPNPQISSTSQPQEESRKLISNTPKILTHKDFMYPTQTVTKSYNFDEDIIYEPRKLKAINNDPIFKPSPNSANEVSNSQEIKPFQLELFQGSSDSNDKVWPKTEYEYKESTTSESHISTAGNVKFSDFIFQGSKNDFKPIVTTTSTEAPQLLDTTTQNVVEDILQNNIFLKNLFNPERTETVGSKTPEHIPEINSYPDVKHDLETNQYTESKQQQNDKQYPEINSYTEVNQQQDNKHYLEVNSYTEVKQQQDEKQNKEYPQYYPHLNQYPDIKPYSQVKRYPEIQPIQEVQQIPEINTQDSITEEPKTQLQKKAEAEPKTDKVSKLVPYQPLKPVNEVKMFQKKPVDIAELLNYVSMKNHFESSKVKNKFHNNKHVNSDQRHEMRFIPIQQENNENNKLPEFKSTIRPLTQQQNELKGMIKNYKVLQRNNNNVRHESNQLNRDLSPPPVKSHLPPLGRAGPSVKSYLPPIFI